MAAELSDKERRAIAALLVEPTVQSAAARVGIGQRTLRRWLDDPEFRTDYAAASRDRLAETVGRLRAAAGDAVEMLRAALKDEHASNRIRAAIALLDIAVKVEVDDLARRVAELESALRAT